MYRDLQIPETSVGNQCIRSYWSATRSQSMVCAAAAAPALVMCCFNAPIIIIMTEGQKTCGTSGVVLEKSVRLPLCDCKYNIMSRVWE